MDQKEVLDRVRDWAQGTEHGAAAAQVLKILHGSASNQAELRFRREWAEKIIAEFSPYHEHPSGGGECGTCGAIQAARWMHPDMDELGRPTKNGDVQ